ncbi:hypothetical protein GobsT_72350 [Gemmata obscuriglobus]|uniref:DUF1800 domain-containing protein n=1 Tax=Gemmata obscuriglobus TaxID=114 RepID=UPI00016C5909|nr:DUF1800 domain-containing protein [Gemmata obscuriglobus]QEG32380.1 hypothetical protein GobsT_72350 [Gemmata obscuriglobus]VTS11736.1 Uncharacterized protein OS=Singulisphaera acidiphila (strain ATCC BAA-1392 / DSM 18658 / VKM B-2454 / MOB10) GN=Sinac_7507 PE=4 SV=1: DUF1800 [Gemmata obscuriglobus UQM 2246]
MAESLPADLSKVDPADAWRPWQPAAGEWNRKWVAHLYRRAGFGATPAEIDQALAQGPTKTLDRFLTGEPDQAERLELLTESGKFYTEPANLRVWWLYAMTEGGHPLREKLALFWHNHFATSYAKVRSTSLMYEQNVTIRKHALGKFRPFLLDMSKDPAMLVWLDSNRNVKGAPNENYAREVMELFSLGVGNNNYTEKDIQEAARALTGWHHDAEVKQFEFNRDLHDDGTKTVFGKTGRWTGEDVVRLCCDHAACPKFLVSKLYAFLVSEEAPPKGLLAPLADQFRKSDYDIADLVRTVLGSRLFFSAHAYRKRVKWPVECALGAVRTAVATRVPLADLLEPLAKMGQALFSPPNVKGWRTGTDWLNSATLLSRNNFAEKVALGTWSQSGRSESGAVALKTYATEPNVQEYGPGPDAKFDVCAAVYAGKPKDVTAVVKRMGELLYGEAVTPAQAKKIETFLLTPGPAAPAPANPKGPAAKGKGAKVAAPSQPPEAPKEAPKGEKKDSKKEPHKPLDPKDVKLDSADFKARVREAYHAMMCLPEYQLN